MTYTVRMLPPPAPSAHDPIRINGRTYASAGAAFIDFPDADAVIADANDWQWLGVVGTTAQRPAAANLAATINDVSPTFGPLTKYIDTTLGKTILWDAASKVWRDPLTGAAV